MHNRNNVDFKGIVKSHILLFVGLRSFNRFVPNDHSLEHFSWKLNPLQVIFFFPFPFLKVRKKQKNP